MEKWFDVLTRVDQLMKRSVLRRGQSTSLLQQNKITITRAEETITRYDQVKKVIKEMNESKDSPS
jgi:hypothetical protein